MAGPVLQQYADYKLFLKSYYRWMRKDNRRWSYGVWARRLDLQDTSSITKVVNGQRVPGPKMVKKFSEYFKFNSDEQVYFKELVTLAKFADNPKVQTAYLEKIGKKHQHSSTRVVDEATFTKAFSWYSIVIRELTRREDFKEDVTWIQSQFAFPVSESEVQEAIKVMTDLGLILRDVRGRLQATSEKIRSTRDISVEAIKRYHEAMLERAQLGVRKFGVETREYGATSFFMNQDNILKAKELLREFREKFETLLEEPGGDTLYQMQFQLFPLSVNCPLRSPSEGTNE
jgi:uncharacterized protein (TIGR02147 family)